MFIINTTQKCSLLSTGIRNDIAKHIVTNKYVSGPRFLCLRNSPFTFDLQRQGIEIISVPRIVFPVLE